ncbi:hypothetical protein GGF47_000648, partial [Coemansia sp. RSA 2524]
ARAASILMTPVRIMIPLIFLATTRWVTLINLTARNRCKMQKLKQLLRHIFPTWWLLVLPYCREIIFRTIRTRV